MSAIKDTAVHTIASIRGKKIPADYEVIDLTDDDPLPLPRTSIYPASRNTKLLSLRLSASNAIPQPPPKPKPKYIRKAKANPVPNFPTESKQFDLISLANFDKFELFPKLPIELRLKIWKNVLNAPRKLKVTIDWTISWKSEDAGTDPTGFQLTPVVAASHVHGAIRACKESNAEVKKLGGKLQIDDVSGLKTIYFDPKKDTVVQGESSIYGFIACCTEFFFIKSIDTTFTNTTFHGFENIQKLEIDGKGWEEQKCVRQALSTLLEKALLGVKSLQLLPKLPHILSHQEYSEDINLLLRNFDPTTCMAAWPRGKTPVITQEVLGVLATYAWQPVKWSKPPGMVVEGFRDFEDQAKSS